MRTRIAGLAVAATLSIVGPVKADFVFNFTDGALGVQPNNPQVFTASGAGNEAYTISALAKGPSLNGHPAQLYVKAQGPGESGLGLTNDPTGDHEVTPGSFIQLDFSALKTLIGSAQIGFSFGSVQAGEGFTLYASNSPNLPPGGGANVLWSVTNTNNHSAVYSRTFDASVFANYKYFDVTATGGNSCDVANILVGPVTIKNPTLVPEPGSFALLGLGLVGVLGVARWRKRVAAA